MRKLGNVVGNVDDLRREREARMNPPEYEAGQGDNDDWDFFSDDGGFNNMDESAFGGSNQGSGMDLGGLGGAISSLGGGNVQGGFSNSPQQMAQNMTSTEDKVIEGVVHVGKYAWKGCRELFNGIHDGVRGKDAFYWTIFGKKVMFVSIWVSVGGGVLSLLGLVASLKNGFFVFIGGFISLAIGVLIFSLNCDKAREISKTLPREEYVVDEEVYDLNEDSPVEDDSYEEDNGGWGGFSEDYEEGYEEEEEEYDPWSNMNESFESSSSEDYTSDIGKEVDIDSAINNIREIPASTQTRQYLYEEYSRVLPLYNPEFATLKPISENSDDFIIFDKILRDASLQVGTKEEKIPELLELRENQFIIQIKASRPSGLKEDDIASEIANIYSRDEYGAIIHEGVYATTSSVGSNYIINIFKGENSLVTLADTYKEVKDFVLDTSVKKPIIMGVNELGRVWKLDAEKVFSYIISGKPRSGKSWSVVSLVLQLCMYSSPREVNFEVFDVKGTSSDYYTMKDYLPHFKKFESSGKLILQRLRYLTTVEADRRKKILKANDVIAIADLKNKGIEAEIPYLYVLIDEIVGLIGTFTKEEHAEFKDLVNVLITQMPNLGIRLILIPHRVTNDIVPKTTYTNVGCIACVKSDFKEIINTLDITKKDFPYDLSNTGDMALKTGEINKGKTVFCHGVAVTTSNDSNVGIYKFVGSLWGKLEPDSIIVKEETVERKEVYKGHNIEGVDSIVGSEDFMDDDITDDFWDSI